MKDLNEIILKNFRDNVAISKLEEELNMKKAIRKQVVTFAMLSIIFLSGSFFTVNAATDGKLIENVKDFITVKSNSDKYKIIESNRGKDKNGQEYIECKLESVDGKEEIHIKTYDDNLNDVNTKLTYDLNKDDSLEIVVENK